MFVFKQIEGICIRIVRWMRWCLFLWFCMLTGIAFSQDVVTEQGGADQNQETQGGGDQLQKTEVELDNSKVKSLLLSPNILIDIRVAQIIQRVIVLNKNHPRKTLSIAQNKKGGFELKMQALADVGLSESPLAKGDFRHIFSLRNTRRFWELNSGYLEQLVGYKHESFNRKRVILQENAAVGETFFTAWKMIQIKDEPWYLLQSYYEPKRCLSAKSQKKLSVKGCALKDLGQHWGFHLK